MINKFSVAKALGDKLKDVCIDNSFTLIPQGESIETSVTGSYVRDFVLYGDDNPVGLDDASSDIMLGIYQINLLTPLTENGGKWVSLTNAVIIQTAFIRGLTLTHNSQSLRIKSTSLTQLSKTETHYVHVLSVNFSVID
jgi:hypothetical protein